MNLEVSTLNILLSVLIALQAWIVRELFRIKTRLAIMAEHLKLRPHHDE